MVPLGSLEEVSDEGQRLLVRGKLFRLWGFSKKMRSRREIDSRLSTRLEFDVLIGEDSAKLAKDEAGAMTPRLGGIKFFLDFYCLRYIKYYQIFLLAFGQLVNLKRYRED